MGASSVTIEGVPAPKSNRQPRLLVRGRRRKALIGALNHMTTLFNQDNAENRRASVRKYTPFLVLGGLNSKAMAAFTVMIETLIDAKLAKA